MAEDERNLAWHWGRKPNEGEGTIWHETTRENAIKDFAVSVPQGGSPELITQNKLRHPKTEVIGKLPSPFERKILGTLTNQGAAQKMGKKVIKQTKRQS